MIGTAPGRVKCAFCLALCVFAMKGGGFTYRVAATLYIYLLGIVGVVATRLFTPPPRVPLKKAFAFVQGEPRPSPAGRSPQRAGTHAKCVRILHGARGRDGEGVSNH